MRAEDITPETVKATLRAIRYGKRLATNPFLDHGAVRLRLRDLGHADTPVNREWMLQQYFLALVSDTLAALRAELGVAGVAGGDLAQLAADYRAGSQTLEAWSLLYARYLAPAEPPEGKVLAERLGATVKTLTRRLDRGHRLLSDSLGDADRAAARDLAVRPGAPAAERIVVAPAGGARRPPPPAGGHASRVPGAGPPPSAGDPVDALITAIRDDAAVLHTTAGELDALAHAAASDLDAYRAARVAAWAQPRYALDRRFVSLTLLMDRGEEATERWAVREQRYDDLGAVLAEARDPAIVLIGAPGCGKSTLLRRLELDIAAAGLRRETDALPFFIELSQYRPQAMDAPPPAPLAWLADQWALRFPKLPPLPELMAGHRMLLLLDALNEMPHASPAAYRERLGLWKQLVQTTAAGFGRTRIVFSCRSLDYSASLSTPNLPVPQARIEPMSDDQVRAFLWRYVPAWSEALWASLQASAQLDLLRTPYFLRLLVEQVTATGGEVPQGRAALFTGFVRRALRREVERDNPLFQPDGLINERDYQRIASARAWRTPWELPERGKLIPKLAALAHGMQRVHRAGEGAQVRVPYDDALDLLDDPQDAAILAAGSSLAVLDEDRDRDEVGFYHQLLQEYFAARRQTREPEVELVRREWRKDRVSPGVRELIGTLPASEALPPLPQTGWEETMLLASAMAAEPSGLIHRLREPNLALSGRAAGQPEVRERLEGTFLDALRWSLVRRSRDPAADLRDRIDCGLAVGELGDPRFGCRAGPQGAYLMPPLAEIPGGNYPIGEDEPLYLPDQDEYDSTHVPRHMVAVAPFAIGKFPVTNAEWRCFMAAGGYEDERWWDTAAGRAWRLGRTAAGVHANVRHWWRVFKAHPERVEKAYAHWQWTEEIYERWRRRLVMTEAELEAHLQALFPGGRLIEPRFWQDPRLNRAAQPVVGICWYEMRAYCLWLSAQTGLAVRLPTEVEWEAAARGREGRVFAYGNELDPLRCNLPALHLKQSSPVGVFPEGDTPEGVCDLTGNVAEWTSSAFSSWTRDPDGLRPMFAYPYAADDGREAVETGDDITRVGRGGAWSGSPALARAAARYSDQPDSRLYYSGGRIVIAR